MQIKQRVQPLFARLAVTTYNATRETLAITLKTIAIYFLILSLYSVGFFHLVGNAVIVFCIIKMCA